jgi:hypothetical protein
MKTLIGFVAVAGVLALSAGSASAQSSWQCKQYAQNYASQYGNPGASAVGGALLGGAANSGYTYNQAYNAAYWDCMNNGGPGPQPVYGPGPSYAPGSQAWYQACAAKYKSFQWDGPYAGYFKGYDGQWHQCQL